MGGMEWDESLATGNPEIDGQHREMFGRAARFFSLAASAAGTHELRIAFEFLAGYVRIHFADEEMLMADLGYPGRGAHTEAHRSYVAMLEALRGQFEEQPDAAAVVAGLRELWSGWG
jgi:hemerythrin